MFDKHQWHAENQYDQVLYSRLLAPSRYSHPLSPILYLTLTTMENPIIQGLIANVTGSFQALWDGTLSILPGIVIGIVLLIVGYIIAVILGKVVGKVIDVIRLNDLLTTAGVMGFFQKAGIKLNIDRVFEEVVKWFVIVVFLISAANAFQLPQVVEFLKQVLNYIPNVIIAVLITIAGVLIANFIATLAHGTSKATKTGHPGLVAAIIRYAVIIFTIIAALGQLKIGETILASFSNSLGLALAGAFGLAFGLGGKDLAADLLKQIKSEIK